MSEPAPRAPTRKGRGGFVLAFVVFMLFAISLAGATAYLLVASEFTLARHAGDGAEALTVARAGLERYVAESLGVLEDTASYALGDGVAVVTPRKLFEQDSLTALYYIRSEATVADPRMPGTPARRMVGAYATYRRRPLPHHAAVIIGSDVVGVDASKGGRALAFDHDLATDCAGGGASTVTGVIARTSVTEVGASSIQGSPETRLWPGGWSEIRDSIGIRWDVLKDPDFPVDFENTLPDFGAIPADSFPVIRYSGWVSAGWTGRGVLIVDGVFDPVPSFQWEGIVLAKHIDGLPQGGIDGMLIAGLDEPNMYSTVEFEVDVNYHSCSVYGANESLSYLELIPNTVHEID